VLSKGTDDDVALVKVLQDEVQALKSRCNILEKTVKDLQSICDTHERSLDSFRKAIVRHLGSRGTLDLNLQGEELEVMTSLVIASDSIE
jgi:hypothetical protein